MRLTKAQREDALDQLTYAAIKHNIPSLNVSFKETQKLFWEDRGVMLDQVVKLPREDWARLIQSGCIHGMSSASPETKIQGCWRPIRRNIWSDGDRRAAVLALILARPGASAIKECLTAHTHTHDVGYRWVIKANYTWPRTNGIERLEDGSPVILSIKASDDLLTEVLRAGAEFRKECDAILTACKSLKQLEDLFPEAAKLIQAPLPKRTEIVPVEAANALRLKLAAGVPPKQAE